MSQARIAWRNPLDSATAQTESKFANNIYIQKAYMYKFLLLVHRLSLVKFEYIFLYPSSIYSEACVNGSTHIIPSRSLQGYPQRCSHSRTPVAKRARDAPRAVS